VLSGTGRSKYVSNSIESTDNSELPIFSPRHEFSRVCRSRCSIECYPVIEKYGVICSSNHERTHSRAERQYAFPWGSEKYTGISLLRKLRKRRHFVPRMRHWTPLSPCLSLPLSLTMFSPWYQILNLQVHISRSYC
jgi:hypothetical protein